MRQKYVEYRVKLIKDEEERRAQERAAYIQAEKEAKQKAEKEARQKIEQKAIDEYKKKQDEIQNRKLEKEQNFKEELEKLGLEPEKIKSIIETSGFQALEMDSVNQSLANTRHSKASLGEQDGTKDQIEMSSIAASKTMNGSIHSSRPWWVHTFPNLSSC